MIKMQRLILSLLLPLFLGSCAPKVLTHIEKEYPSRIAADEVHLYGVGQTVPETAERIGSVRVVDGGASTKCNYEQVVALAKQETAKSGGNALALTDHRKPPAICFGSATRQIGKRGRLLICLLRLVIKIPPVWLKVLSGTARSMLMSVMLL